MDEEEYGRIRVREKSRRVIFLIVAGGSCSLAVLGEYRAI
jgi:hypothetical protein